VDQLHYAAGNGQGLRQTKSTKTLAETAAQITGSQSAKLIGIVSLAHHGYQFAPVSRADSSGGAQVNSRSYDSFSGIQFLAGKEPCTAVLHGHQRFAVDSSVKPETEQIGVSLAEETLDADIVADSFPRLRKGSVKGNHGIQQAVDRQAAGNEVDPQIAGKE